MVLFVIGTALNASHPTSKINHDILTFNALIEKIEKGEAVEHRELKESYRQAARVFKTSNWLFGKNYLSALTKYDQAYNSAACESSLEFDELVDSGASTREFRGDFSETLSHWASSHNRDVKAFCEPFNYPTSSKDYK
jgi:hypothetical protein